MKVKDLIKELQKFDSDSEVFAEDVDNVIFPIEYVSEYEGDVLISSEWSNE